VLFSQFSSRDIHPMVNTIPASRWKKRPRIAEMSRECPIPGSLKQHPSLLPRGRLRTILELLGSN